MNVLVIGGDGMLGHQILGCLSETHTVKVSLSQQLSAYQKFGMFSEANAFSGIDIRSDSQVLEMFAAFKPDVLINAAGIVKQRSAALGDMVSIHINALLPHKLAMLCEISGTRMVHMSTDCVFSGSKGNYSEDDLSDAQDIYGRTKYLGELSYPHCVTLRTSFIGLELQRFSGIIEWFLGVTGTVQGFSKAIYSGLTTREMARVINHVIVNEPDMNGLWHVSSEPINKYDMLNRLSKGLERDDVELVPNDELVCDRSLDSSRFYAQTGLKRPGWDEMIEELTEQIKQRAERGVI